VVQSQLGLFTGHICAQRISSFNQLWLRHKWQDQIAEVEIPKPLYVMKHYNYVEYGQITSAWLNASLNDQIHFHMTRSVFVTCQDVILLCVILGALFTYIVYK